MYFLELKMFDVDDNDIVSKQPRLEITGRVYGLDRDYDISPSMSDEARSVLLVGLDYLGKLTNERN